MACIFRHAVCAGVLLWAAALATHAQEPLRAAGAPVAPQGRLAPEARMDLADWPKASDAQLDGLRGGFDLGGGLAISFGFVRSISVNGELVSQVRFVLPDLSHISAEQARTVSDALAQSQVVQVGPGNSAPAGGAAVVQNSLNNQLLQSRTVIDAGVNSLAALRALNIQGLVRDALLNALGSTAR